MRTNFQYVVRPIVACIILLSSGSMSQAQEKVMPIDMATVLKLAGSSNLDVAMINARYELAKAEQIKSKEWMLPTIGPGILLMAHDGFDQFTDGTFINVSGRNNFWARLNVAADWDFGTAVFSYLSAKQNVESVGYERQVQQNKTNVRAVKAYFDLSAAQSKLVALEKMGKKAEAIVTQIKVQVEQGIIYKSDLLLAKANVNHIKIEISKAQSTIQRKSHSLLELLNITDNVQLLVSDSLLVPVNLVDTSKVEINAAYEKRPELLVYASRVEGLKIARKSETTGLMLPSLNFGLNTGPFGPQFSPKGNAFGYYVGAKWDIPLGVLFYGGAKKQYDAQIQIEQINLDRAKNLIRREVQDEEMNLHSSNTRMLLAKAAVGYGQEALDQSMERQRLGTAIPLEVLKAQEQMMEAQLDLIDAVSQYNKAQYGLYIALGNNP